MSYQFIHVEAYGDRPPAKAPNKLTMAQVAAENERQEGNAPHVEDPIPPVLLDGRMPSEVVGMAREHLKEGRTPVRGGYRKLRADANIVVCGVASHPYTCSELATDREKLTEYMLWECDTLEWLQDRYGGKLRSVLRHIDEERVHLHFWVLDDLERQEGTSISHGVSRIHDGIAAKRKEKAAGATPKAQDLAYKAAMRRFQDDYFEAVGIKNGLARTGPKRRRLTRKQWQEEKADRRAMMKVREQIEQLKREREETLDQLGAMRIDLKVADIDRRKWREEEAAMKDRRQELKTREEAIANREEQAAQKETQVAERERDIDQFAAVLDNTDLDLENLTFAVRSWDRLRPRVRGWVERVTEAIQDKLSWAREKLHQQQEVVARTNAAAAEREDSAKSLITALRLFMRRKLFVGKDAKGWLVTSDVPEGQRQLVKQTLQQFPEQLLELNDNFEAATLAAVANEKKRLKLLEEQRLKEIEELRAAKELLAKHNHIVAQHVSMLTQKQREELRQALEAEQIAGRMTDDRAG